MNSDRTQQALNRPSRLLRVVATPHPGPSRTATADGRQIEKPIVIEPSQPETWTGGSMGELAGGCARARANRESEDSFISGQLSVRGLVAIPV